MAVQRGARITGDQRATMARELGERYAAGESIRTLADSTGRSYGFVQALVKESGVSVRSRGGAVARPAGAARPAGSGSPTGRRRSVATRRATTAKRATTKTAATKIPRRRSTGQVVTAEGDVGVPARAGTADGAGTEALAPAYSDARGSVATLADAAGAPGTVAAKGKDAKKAKKGKDAGAKGKDGKKDKDKKAKDDKKKSSGKDKDKKAAKGKK